MKLQSPHPAAAIGLVERLASPPHIIMKLDKMSEAVVTRLWTTGSQRLQSLREEMCEVGPTVPQPSALGQFPVHGTGWEKSVYGGSAELRRQRPEFGAAEVAGTFRVQRGDQCRDGVAEDWELPLDPKPSPRLLQD